MARVVFYFAFWFFFIICFVQNKKEHISNETHPFVYCVAQKMRETREIEPNTK